MVPLPATVASSAEMEGVHDRFLGGLRLFTLDLDARGRAVIAASGRNARGEFWEAVVFRLARRGRFDRAFSRDGSLSAGNDSLKFGFLSIARIRVAVLPGPRIVLVTPADVGPVVLAYREDGRRDRRFGHSGAEQVGFFPFDLEPDLTGRILMAGVDFPNAGTDFALARLSACQGVRIRLSDLPSRRPRTPPGSCARDAP
jgi:hypothetical protein